MNSVLVVKLSIAPNADIAEFTSKPCVILKARFDRAFIEQQSAGPAVTFFLEEMFLNSQPFNGLRTDPTQDGFWPWPPGNSPPGRRPLILQGVPRLCTV
ncbi:MAG TPA: hypothetical protein VF148_03925 [Acidimicrobiia bacterium]